MDEYIKREDAIDAVLDVYCDTPDIDLSCEKFEAAILKIPAADVAPVRHGEWLKAEDDYCGLNIIQCSICHEEWCFEIDDDVIDLNYHYCPNCGAKMNGKELKIRRADE